MQFFASWHMLYVHGSATHCLTLLSTSSTGAAYLENAVSIKLIQGKSIHQAFHRWEEKKELSLAVGGRTSELPSDQVLSAQRMSATNTDSIGTKTSKVSKDHKKVGRRHYSFFSRKERSQTFSVWKTVTPTITISMLNHWSPSNMLHANKYYG